MKIRLLGASGRLGSAVRKLLPPEISLGEPPDVLVACCLGNPLPQAVDLGVPTVLATTGIAPEEIHQAAVRIPLFYDNYSLGVAVFRRVVGEVARLFPAQVDLIEAHHRHKKDAPSGTALLLADAVAQHQQRPAIHSIRSGETIGEHTLRFNTDYEELTLTHRAHSREVYAAGILLAIRYLVDKPPGLYTMQDLIVQQFK